MKLNMGQRKAVTNQLLIRYQKAGKKDKSQILKEFTAITGYNRHYAALRLRQPALTKKQKKRKTKVSHPRVYDMEVFRELKRIWFIWDCICSKRLVPILLEAVAKMEHFGEARYHSELKKNFYPLVQLQLTEC